MEKQYWFFKIPYSTSTKFVKTSNTWCEVYLKSDFGNKYEQFNKSYPHWDEDEALQITEQEYIQTIATIDLDFKARTPMNHTYRFNPRKCAI